MVDTATRSLVWSRAAQRCEYCVLHQDASPFATFHIEHIIAKVHGGTDDIENLALACDHCNVHKGTNLSGIDPDSGKIIPLFNPRQQRWEEHFQLGSTISGKTPTGRSTIAVLKVNKPHRVRIRSSLIADGEM